MEYGICMAHSSHLPADPREMSPSRWQAVLPPGTLKALYFGSEFCETLLPDPKQAEGFCDCAGEAGIEPVLLTPVVTSQGLEAVHQLLKRLTGGGRRPAVAFNDWGVLDLLRNSYPGLPRRAGRLINRGLRDPRLIEKLAAPDAVLADRGQRLRTMLLHMGVCAVETDPDLEGSFLGEPAEGLQRVLYLPYVFTATGRNCLVKAEAAEPDRSFTKGLASPCAGRCLDQWHAIERKDTAVPLWRAGNTIFYEVPLNWAQIHMAQADRIVLHQRPLS